MQQQLLTLLFFGLLFYSCNEKIVEQNATLTDSILKDTIQKPQPEVTVKKADHPTYTIDGKLIIYPNGETFETNLFDLELIAVLKTTSNEPYFIMGGKQCDECDANISIYIHSPSKGQMLNEDAQPRYTHPGKLFNYEDGRLIGETRMFWGEVLPGRKGAIWYWTTKMTVNENNKSVYFAELINDEITGFELTNDISETLKQVRSKKAFEVEGLDMDAEP